MGGHTPLGKVIWESKDLREHVEMWDNILETGGSKSSEMYHKVGACVVCPRNCKGPVSFYSDCF